MKILLLVLAFVLTAMQCVAAPGLPKVAGAPLAAQSPSGDTFPNKSITIYVADFDLDFARVPGTHPPPGNPTDRPVSPTANAAPNLGSGSSAATTSPQAQASTTPAPSAGSRTTSSDRARSDAAHNDAATDGSRGDRTREDGTKPEVIQEDSPRAQAAKLVNLTSRTLVKVLEQQGYVVRPIRGTTAQPDRGIIIRGVFAQLDETKTLRRVVVGGAVT
ncbi:MAG TPA: DUF4410 domain-containing protein, partial [Candidatus Dormibacteraeota bacterium]|nr:DUF4410 domain-containing protein [Candidatus Dormibacteraeota bacterium]